MFHYLRNILNKLILWRTNNIPESEKWLYKNKEALNKVKSGLKDAKKGKFIKCKYK